MAYLGGIVLQIWGVGVVEIIFRVGRGGREENSPKTLYLLGNTMTIKI